uniref:THAP-type domain-containing protein n=1 Tax=Caenorhabditis tropicalis TaxID=1561998 RepID=A0A1I7TSM7_9PELO
MSEEREITLATLDSSRDIKCEVDDCATKSFSMPTLSKRRFLLVSRQVVTGRRRNPERRWPDIPQNPHFKPRNSGKLPIKVSHRLCQVCHIIRPVSEIFMITGEVEKLFVLLFAIYRKKMIVHESTRLYKQPALYTCRDHCSETSSEILNIFGVNAATGIFRARQRKVVEVIRLVNHLTGKVTDESKLLNLAYLFMMQYPERSAVVGPMVKEEDIPYERTIECQTAETAETILPKCFRQPRKQRLETEEEGCSSSMVRVIKQSTVLLPTQSDSSSLQPLRNPVRCTYCFDVREKQHMVNISKTKYRLSRWKEQLGQEFGERLLSIMINYMCRKHFSPMDFSSCGRLRREAIPIVDPPPEVHTFKIDGNDFVKVSEEELKKN